MDMNVHLHGFLVSVFDVGMFRDALSDYGLISSSIT